MCGCWVEVCTTSWPSREFHCATTPRPSSGLMTWRAVRSSRVTEYGGLGLDGLEVHVDVGGEEQVVAPVLVHQRRAGLARRPACRRTAGSGSKSSSISAARSSASARVGATHMATSSPTWRTLPVARTGCTEDLKPGSVVSARIGATPAGPSAMKTRSRSAGGMLIDLDARVRQRAAQERHLQHARQPDVADILAAPAHVAVVLLAQEPRADALVDDVPCHALLPRLFPHSFYL